jgi:hypothetical protein
VEVFGHFDTDIDCLWGLLLKFDQSLEYRDLFADKRATRLQCSKEISSRLMQKKRLMAQKS